MEIAGEVERLQTNQNMKTMKNKKTIENSV